MQTGADLEDRKKAHPSTQHPAPQLGTLSPTCPCSRTLHTAGLFSPSPSSPSSACQLQLTSKGILRWGLSLPPAHNFHTGIAQAIHLLPHHGTMSPNFCKTIHTHDQTHTCIISLWAKVGSRRRRVELYMYMHMSYVRIEQSRSTVVHMEIKNKLRFLYSQVYWYTYTPPTRLWGWFSVNLSFQCPVPIHFSHVI